jgi:hypothetical protein
MFPVSCPLGLGVAIGLKAGGGRFWLVAIATWPLPKIKGHPHSSELPYAVRSTEVAPDPQVSAY